MLFRKYDKNRNGLLVAEEMKELLTEMNSIVPPMDAMEELDIPPSGIGKEQCTGVIKEYNTYMKKRSARMKESNP